MISLIIPSHNNLRHLKNAYASILKHAPKIEVILLDDGSTDGTWEWIWQLAESHQHREVKAYRSKERVGHTVLYDKGIELATNEIVGIMHADMIMGPNYVENILKHLKPGVVVCGTRIEPPLHPEGKEKIIANFGLDFDDLNVPAFEDFCLKKQKEFEGQTTKGMFAPWAIYKKDFVSMGGHDAAFAPFPYEDSDIFQRWLLAGYELVQSRDAFVYHLTCRGHRWTEKIQQDDDYYKNASRNAGRNYLRKWGTWIKNDEYQHPIVPKIYDIAFKINNADLKIIEALEPWCKNLFVDGEWSVVKEYIIREQPYSIVDLNSKIKPIEFDSNNRVIIEFDCRDMNNNRFHEFISKLDEIITQVEESGTYEWDVFRITIKDLNPIKIQLPFLLKKNNF
jgi:glycosyltransferase involved in cell wall biosynthesis